MQTATSPLDERMMGFVTTGSSRLLGWPWALWVKGHHCKNLVVGDLGLVLTLLSSCFLTCRMAVRTSTSYGVGRGVVVDKIEKLSNTRFSTNLQLTGRICLCF